MTAPAPTPEPPTLGGSYIQHPDGSLERVAFTEAAPIGGEDAADPADDGQEG